MIFSYKTRRGFRRLINTLLALAAIAIVALLCWLLWLQRFIIYTDQGAILDFSLSQTLPQGVEAKPLEPGPSVSIHYGQDSDPDPNAPQGPQKLVGYYVTVQELLDDLPGVLQKLQALPQGTAVLLDVKNHWGYFYYPTTVGQTTARNFDMAAMSQFLEQVNSLGLHTIARLPAFRDYDFAAANNSCGLPVKEGYLWVDEARCYWLDPSDDLVLTYLIQISKELEQLGFDEVLFQDFRIPESESIVFQGDRIQALEKAAKTLVTACGSEDFTVSFLAAGQMMTLPEGSCRLYLQDVAAVDVSDQLAQYSLLDPATQIVFIAQTGDTRYDVAGTLRPLDMAH